MHLRLYGSGFFELRALRLTASGFLSLGLVGWKGFGLKAKALGFRYRGELRRESTSKILSCGPQTLSPDPRKQRTSPES